MKKHIFILVSLFMLCSCSSGLSSEKYDIKIGMSISKTDDYINSVCESAKKAANDAHVGLEIAVADNNQSEQTKQIKAWVDDGYAGVIVLLCDENAAEYVLGAAKDTPVVFINRLPRDTTIFEDRQNTMYIGSEDTNAGNLQGEFLAQYFLKQNKNSPKIVVVNGGKTDETSKTRISSAKKTLSDNGLMPFYINEFSGEWNEHTAHEKMHEYLKEKPEVDAVLAANDAMAIGASKALAQAGYALSSIPIVGVDATSEGRQAIKSGEIDFTVYQDPNEQGAGAVYEILNMLGGALPTDGQIVLQEYTPITSANISEYFPDE